MNLPGFENLFEMGLLLDVDSKNNLRAVSYSDPGFRWTLDCQQRNYASFLQIGREKTTDAYLNGDRTLIIFLIGPNFAHFFQPLSRNGILKNIEFPPITKDSRYPDYSRSVNILCKFLKISVRRRNVKVNCKTVSVDTGNWHFPTILFVKEYWSTSFTIILKIDDATVEYEVILNETGLISFQTEQAVPIAVRFGGNFEFRGEKHDFQLIFQPGELKKQVCEIRLSTHSNFDEDMCFINYRVFMQIDTD